MSKSKSTGQPSSRHVFTFIGEACGEKTWQIAPEEEHHLKKVLRLSDGATVRVIDGKGHFAEGVLQFGEVSIQVATTAAGEEQPARLPLTLLLAATKPTTLEQTLPHLVELGADQIVIFPQPGQPKHRLNPKSRDRLAKIIREATKQCKRTWLPGLQLTEDFDQVLKQLPTAQHRFVLTDAGAADLGKQLSTLKPPIAGLTLLVGSEEGLLVSPETLTQAQFQPASLGDHTLRATTAAIASAAIISSWRRHSSL